MASNKVVPVDYSSCLQQIERKEDATPDDAGAQASQQQMERKEGATPDAAATTTAETSQQTEKSKNGQVPPLDSGHLKKYDETATQMTDLSADVEKLSGEDKDKKEKAKKTSAEKSVICVAEDSKDREKDMTEDGERLASRKRRRSMGEGGLIMTKKWSTITKPPSTSEGDAELQVPPAAHRNRKKHPQGIWCCGCLDADGDGKIRAADLISVLDKDGDGKLGAGDFLAAMDKDGDGKITLSDAEIFMREFLDDTPFEHAMKNPHLNKHLFFHNLGLLFPAIGFIITGWVHNSAWLILNGTTGVVTQAVGLFGNLAMSRDRAKWSAVDEDGDGVVEPMMESFGQEVLEIFFYLSLLQVVSCAVCGMQNVLETKYGMAFCEFAIILFQAFAIRETVRVVTLFEIVQGLSVSESR